MKSEARAWGYNWANLFLGGYKKGDLSVQGGGVENVKE
jgi:hypothetical protein